MRELAFPKIALNLRAGFASLVALERSSCVGVIARLEAGFLCVFRDVLWDAEDGEAFWDCKMPRHPHVLGVAA